MNLKLKICGMKHNTEEVAKLSPDYLGFIFYDKSPRNYTGETFGYDFEAKKVGVFVNPTVEFVMGTVKKYSLDIIQLHGEESADFCGQLKLELNQEFDEIAIWKVFGIKDSFNFEILTPYEEEVDKFLFDTKGKEKGGNGYTFNWNVLKDYPSKKPFILSGGIGLEEISEVKNLMKTNLPIYAIDVNSRFETSPGLKNISELKKLKKKLA